MTSETLYSSLYNPDVLSCIANLSNDEVFTPPSVVNAMLDMLPQELFRSPTTTFLDPATKSGVFLREIAKRLIAGLADQIPDLQTRLDHIFHKQVFGIAITELTSLLARRSVYCSKYPNGEYSVSRFENGAGNVRFTHTQHRWQNGKCVFCGTSQSARLGGTERGVSLEAHAYEWIHTAKPEEIFGMKFDVIIGNPPYQLETDGAGKQAKPIYHIFVEQAMKLSPRFLVMITPSRWLSGGMGLDDYRARMLRNRHIRRMVDYSLSTECFPGVDVAGGINYFLWERDTTGDCQYTYIDNGSQTTQLRVLDEYDVFVRNNSALSIIKKIVAHREESISKGMSSLGVFGLGTAERGVKNSSPETYALLSSAGRSYIDKHDVHQGLGYIDKWKVIIGKATSAGAATANRDGLRKVIATLDVLEPNAVCTFSYFIGGAFSTKQEADNCRAYLSTKFARFLLLQCLSSINITKDRFRFVPIQDFKEVFTDELLYKKYDLSSQEVALIESTIKPMDAGGSDDA